MINSVTLIGRIGSIDTKTMSNGSSITKISVATSEKWKDQAGEKKEKTTWHTVNYFSKLAEIVAQYGSVGDLVYVLGKINHTKAVGKDGMERDFHSITATEFKIMPKGEKTKKSNDEPEPVHFGQTPSLSLGGLPNDDIPF